MIRGILYGIGVGPGDPELMTRKAVRTMMECDVIALPRKDRAKCPALRIASAAVPEVLEKPMVEIHMPMTKDADALEQAFAQGAEQLREELDKGKTVGFLTLGDPSVYSTFSYLQRRLARQGYETRVIPGVTSFCAAAAALNRPLCEGREELHLIPGSEDDRQALSYPGTKVLMKGCGAELASRVEELGLTMQMVENCGLEGERVYRCAREIAGAVSYYSVMIVKEKQE